MPPKTPARDRRRASAAALALSEVGLREVGFRGDRIVTRCRDGRTQYSTVGLQLTVVVEHYRNERGKPRESHRTDKKFRADRAWLEGVTHSAKTLADLLEQNQRYETPIHHVMDEWDFLIDHLRRLASDSARRCSLIYQKKGRREDSAAKEFVAALSWLFQECNAGKLPARGSRTAYPAGSKSSSPSGPFFRIVRAAFRLAGDARSDEAIASLIKRHDPQWYRQILQHGWLGRPPDGQK
jgi:hypothetical protein